MNDNNNDNNDKNNNGKHNNTNNNLDFWVSRFVALFAPQRPGVRAEFPDQRGLPKRPILIS